MGRISKGILGGFRGTVGTVVGGRWKGIDYIRSKPSSTRSAVSPKQQVQRAKFKLVSGFLVTLNALLRFSFADFAVNQTGRNHALAYNLENAVTGNYPDLALDYAQVLVSRGSKLPNAAAPSATANGADISFAWQDNTGTGDASANDKAILVVHCPSLNQSLFTVSNATRSQGAASMNAAAFSGLEVHTWLSFQSEDGAEVASSVYTGQLNMQ